MKNYASPSLSVLGSVSDITRAFGPSNQGDIGFIPGPDLTLEGSTDGILVPCGDGSTNC